MSTKVILLVFKLLFKPDGISLSRGRYYRRFDFVCKLYFQSFSKPNQTAFKIFSLHLEGLRIIALFSPYASGF
ncbi:hypothetical protein, partial [Marinicella rhabdoformis]|uniref:hypothetical protein n=1 Tax=Marinicella rhabdoformis TaxID=2580566 RepID=UPI001C552D11